MIEINDSGDNEDKSKKYGRPNSKAPQKKNVPLTAAAAAIAKKNFSKSYVKCMYLNNLFDKFILTDCWRQTR